MPFGTQVLPHGGVRFRLFAPAADAIELLLEGIRETVPMQRSEDGWHEVETTLAGVGSRYKFVLPYGTRVPDPASRFQPLDVDGPSEVIDPCDYVWKDGTWQGLGWNDLVFYEVHVGTWTPDGSFRAAIDKLDHMVRLGVNALELMALAAFPGRWGWSYDPVLYFAPDATYGRPEDLKALVDAAHARGIAVFLDVVYNHFGPSGNYIAKYFPQICTERHKTPWGQGLNFDGPGSHMVRDFIVHNALYWIEEFHLDGLRMDATHTLLDTCKVHILDELQQRVHAMPLGRKLYLVLEHEQNISRKVGRTPAGDIVAFAAQWNYDIPRLLTPVFGNFCQPGTDEETLLAARGTAEGFVNQRIHDGEPPDYMAPPQSFVSYLQTHDLVGNRIVGDRIASNASPELRRALAALLLLLPQIPLVFMGEEWGTATCFPFFSDYTGSISSEEIIKSRREGFLKMKPKPSEEEMARAPDPQAESTFRNSKLDWKELEKPEHAEWLELYQKLIAVRREAIVPLLEGVGEYKGSMRVVEQGAWICSWEMHSGAVLSLALNLCDRTVQGIPEQRGETLWLAGTEPQPGTFGPWTVRWKLQRRTEPAA